MRSKSKKNEHGNYLFEGNNPSIPSVYHRLNSRTYPLNDLDLSFIRENINYSCKIDCELALKKKRRNVYNGRAVPSLAWPSHDMKISHECETQACSTPIAVNCVHNRRKQCSWLTRPDQQVDGKLCFSPFVSHLFPNAVIYHVESSKCKYR